MTNRKWANLRFRIATIYPSVNIQPLMKTPKIDIQHPAPLKMKFRNFKMVGWFTDGKKLQYFIQIEHIKVKIEANKENHIKNYLAFS